MKTREGNWRWATTTARRQQQQRGGGSGGKGNNDKKINVFQTNWATTSWNTHIRTWYALSLKRRRDCSGCISNEVKKSFQQKWKHKKETKNAIDRSMNPNAMRIILARTIWVLKQVMPMPLTTIASTRPHSIPMWRVHSNAIANRFYFVAHSVSRCCVFNTGATYTLRDYQKKSAQNLCNEKRNEEKKNGKKEHNTSEKKGRGESNGKKLNSEEHMPSHISRTTFTAQRCHRI